MKKQARTSYLEQLCFVLSTHFQSEQKTSPSEGHVPLKQELAMMLTASHEW